MTETSPSRLLDRYVLRLPDGMRERIAEVAKANGRSMNSEMVARLEASFSDPHLDPEIDIRAAEVAERIVARVVERIEREPLPRPDREPRPVEDTLSDAERRDLQRLRDTFGAENVEVVEERSLAARVRDPATGSANLLALAHSHAANQQRLDGDLYIVRRALGRDDVEIPVADGRVHLDELPVEPMTRMMLATLLGYVDHLGRPVPQPDLKDRLDRITEGMGFASPSQSSGPGRSGPAKRKIRT